MTFTTHAFIYHLLESTVSLAIHICMYNVFYLSFPLSREVNIWISVMHGGKLLLNTSVLYALWSQRNQNVGVRAKKGPCKETSGMYPKNPKSLKDCSKAVEAKGGRGVISYGQFWVLKSLVFVAVRVGRVVMYLWTPPGQMLISVLQLFNLCMNGLLKVRALRTGCRVYFRL